MLCAPVWAQQPVRIVSLAQVLQAARENTDVLLARDALSAAQADIATADHPQVPVLSIKASSIDLQHGIGGGNFLRDKRIDKSVGVDWTWERGHKREARTRSAVYTAQAARADLEEAQVLQQLAAASAYYDLLAVQERIEHVAAIGRSAGEVAESAQRRLSAGDLSLQEALRAGVEAQRAVADLRAAQGERQRAEVALAQATGFTPSLGAEAVWPSPAAGMATAVELEARGDVRAARQRVQAAQAALDGAIALRQNDVTVGSSIDHLPGTSTRQVELRLQVPLNGLFGAYHFKGEIDRARAQLAQAQGQLVKVERTANADMLRQQQDLRAAAARADLYGTVIVPQARRIAAMADLAYSKRAMSLTDLIEARRTLRNVLLEDVAAKADHARAAVSWQLRNESPTP
ncbi:MAG: TolC family protein [Pseudomonadota bacterium]|nr:TolC family protein [Pseudomonadota bacterium]